MKKPIFETLLDGESKYIPVKWNGHDVIRVSGHAPSPYRLRTGEKTIKCKNVYLIFVKSAIDETRGHSAELAKLIRLKESNDAYKRKLGDVGLNNFIVEIGEDAKKGVNYRIIDANSEDELKKAVYDVRNMLKTTVFVPLKYISPDD